MVRAAVPGWTCLCLLAPPPSSLSAWRLSPPHLMWFGPLFDRPLIPALPICSLVLPLALEVVASPLGASAPDGSCVLSLSPVSTTAAFCLSPPSSCAVFVGHSRRCFSGACSPARSACQEDAAQRAVSHHARVWVPRSGPCRLRFPGLPLRRRPRALALWRCAPGLARLRPSKRAPLSRSGQWHRCGLWPPRAAQPSPSSASRLAPPTPHGPPSSPLLARLLRRPVQCLPAQRSPGPRPPLSPQLSSPPLHVSYTSALASRVGATQNVPCGGTSGVVAAQAQVCSLQPPACSPPQTRGAGHSARLH